MEFRCLCFVVLLTVTVSSIPVNLMLPLNIIEDGELIEPDQIQRDLDKLRVSGANGVMGDVWWGLVEKNPGEYDWSPYLQLANMVRNASLHWQPVMSFHRCGDNVGDTCDIPLPAWVRNVGNSNKGIWYTDNEGRIDEEYISLGVDTQPLFNGRTPLQMYRDFMKSFATTFDSFLGNTIDEIQIGCGPASELRYPSYQSDRWAYCGVGEFQCSDKYMLANLTNAASAAGHPEWGKGGPSNAGSYNNAPSNTQFFSSSGFDNYSSAYGRFFLDWYSAILADHGRAVFRQAREVFGNRVILAGKVSGIHWWYKDYSHAAELTAGYYNTNGNDAYLSLGQKAFVESNITLDFTCFEMKSYDDGCQKDPENLVYQTKKAARQAKLSFSGENALEQCNPNCYEGGFDQIYYQATRDYPINAFTYLRYTRNLFDIDNNWRIFSNFVAKMKAA